jgi:hypothetical protein
MLSKILAWKFNEFASIVCKSNIETSLRVGGKRRKFSYLINKDLRNERNTLKI